MSELIIIAGPNGAGKTTFANTYLPEFTNVREFVNADLIAKGISPFEPDGAMIEAGKLLLDRIHRFINEGKSFALETTLSGKSYAGLFKDAKRAGYRILLCYIYLDSVELSLDRIAERVKNGGHDVPAEVVRRRFDRSLKNFFELYAPLADEWEFFDNSSSEHRRVAKNRSHKVVVLDKELYERITHLYGL